MCNQQCQRQCEEGPTPVWEDAEYRATLLAGDDANVVIESRGDTDARGVQIWEYEESVPFGTSVQNVLLGMSEEIDRLREIVAELQGIKQEIRQRTVDRVGGVDRDDPPANVKWSDVAKELVDLAAKLPPSHGGVDPAQVHNTTKVLDGDDATPAKEDPIAVLYDVWCNVVLPRNVVSRVFDLIKDRHYSAAEREELGSR